MIDQSHEPILPETGNYILTEFVTLRRVSTVETGEVEFLEHGGQTECFHFAGNTE